MNIDYIRDRLGSVVGNTDKFYSMADSGILSLGRLAVGVVLARVAGAEAFGEFVLLTTIGVIIMSLVTAKYFTPMIVLTSGALDVGKGRVIGWFKARLLRVHLVGIVLGVTGLTVVNFFDFDLWIYLAFIASTLSGLELCFYRSRMQSEFRMRRGLNADILGLLSMGGVMYLMWFHFDRPALGFWIGSSIGSGCAIFLMRRCLPENRDANIGSIELEKTELMETTRMGNSMFVGSMANSICSRVQPFVLASVGGTIAVATFGVAWSFLGPIRMLTASLTGVLRPRLAKFRQKEDWVAFNRYSRLSCRTLGVVGAVGVVIAAVLGPNIAVFVFGEPMRSAGYLLPIAFAYATLDAVTTVQMISIQAKGASGAAWATKQRIHVAVLSLVLIGPSCYYFEGWGAFGALLVSESVYLLKARRMLAGGE
mgnify:CR=1 FL=1